MPPRRRLKSACHCSYSKSLTERTPLTMNCAPRDLAKSIAKPSNTCTSTCGSWLYTCRIAATRFSAGLIPGLLTLSPTTPITSLSNSGSTRLTILAWPMVNGSKVPTKTPVLMFLWAKLRKKMRRLRTLCEKNHFFLKVSCEYSLKKS